MRARPTRSDLVSGLVGAMGKTSCRVADDTPARWMPKTHGCDAGLIDSDGKFS